jgi:S-formylglutathione hydrolase FrmB
LKLSLRFARNEAAAAAKRDVEVAQTKGSATHNDSTPAAGPATFSKAPPAVLTEPKAPKLTGAGPVVFAAGRWAEQRVTTDHTIEFPPISRYSSKSVVPLDLQKTPPDRGMFFAPTIDSAALGRTARFGVYLPPGFDPATAEKYPVLVMLPGKGGHLNQWTSVGHAIPTLNEMMAGDHQKMVVVVADNTDSFWYDYDRNGDPRFGQHSGPRDFEGHVMELIAEATKEYKGDPARLSIAGISRGGTGAIQLASRHPGKFASASAQSAILALDHGDNRLGGIAAKSEIAQHFGPIGHQSWSEFTPYDLLRSGRLDKSKTKFYVEVGDRDENMLAGNLDFINKAKQRGVNLTHAVFGTRDPNDGSLTGHNWDFWSKTLPLTVAFHQRAHGGTAPKPSINSKFKLRDSELLEGRKAERAARSAKVTETVQTMNRALPALARHVSQLELPTPRPFEAPGLTELRSIQANAATVAKGLQRELDEVELGDKPLFAKEQRVNELAQTGRRPLDLVDAHVLGVGSPRISTDPAGIRGLPPTVRRDVEALIGLRPETAQPLAQLANRNPALLASVDAMTTFPGTFAAHLLEHASKFITSPKEVEGFATYLERMAHQEWDWRRTGYSHTVNSATSIVFDPPGLILDLIEAAKGQKFIEFSKAYEGDGGSKALTWNDRSRGDFQAGFGPVDQAWSGDSALPSSPLGYERAFLRLVRDTLGAHPDSLPKDRFGRLCGPIAVAMTKLLGKEVQYGYLYNLKTGEDLVGALATQGSFGLSLAEAWVRVGDRPTKHLHFPRFSDFDPVTRTVEMQEWGMGRQRLKVDELTFVGDEGARRDEPQPPAGYFLVNDGIRRYWTPEKQPNAKPPPPPPSNNRWFTDAEGDS